MKKPPVVVLAGVRWDFLWQRHQTLATLFARAGHPTIFVETTGLSNPKPERKSLEHILARVSNTLRTASRRKLGSRTPDEAFHVPEKNLSENLSVYSPLVLPPTESLFRRVNERVFVPRIASDLRRKLGSPPIILAYPPTRTTLDIVSRLEARLVFYDCADEYASFPGSPRDIAATERELLRRADLVSCTSEPLLERVRRLRPDAFLSGPGVEYELFEPLSHEGKSGEVRTVCYFGNLDGARMDFDVLEAIVRAGFELRIVGGSKGAPRHFLRSPGVDFRGEVAHRDLPKALSGLDAFVLPYKMNGLTRGVSPAKTYECLATGKPVVCAPLPAMEKLSEHVYIARGPEEYVEILRRMDRVETEEKSRARLELARRNSWEARFAEIEEAVWRKLG
ncbi:MAG: glycosyltransferase [Actinomycetota bacterium]|jgi:glycosyltransferase involved in cell wall biosynthesis|nr:glycosyltransferase [Actinomycetota bacterium]